MASYAMDNLIRPHLLTNYLLEWDLDPKLLAYRTFPVAIALPNYQIIVNACMCVVFVLLCLFSCLFLCCGLFFCSVFVLCYPCCRVFVLLLLKGFPLPSLQGVCTTFVEGFSSTLVLGFLATLFVWFLRSLLCNLYLIFIIFNKFLLIIKKKKKKLTIIFIKKNGQIIKKRIKKNVNKWLAPFVHALASLNDRHFK